MAYTQRFLENRVLELESQVIAIEITMRMTMDEDTMRMLTNKKEILSHLIKAIKSKSVNTPLPGQQYKVHRPAFPTLTQQVTTIKESELNSVLPDCCGICLENHKMGETLTCDCKHTFGKKCFTRWYKKCVLSKKKVSCPICRSKITTLKSYRSLQSQTKTDVV